MGGSEFKDNGPEKALLRLLDMGGKNMESSRQISTMRNGLRCYSVEVILKYNYYIIQGYEQDAAKLHKIANSISDYKKAIVVKYEK